MMKLLIRRLSALTPSLGTMSTTLTQYLVSSKQRYLSDIVANPARGSEWTVVMGNEAGDLDTLASSIAYAYFLSTHTNTQSVPLLQMDRGDLSLRAENIHALSLAGLTDPDSQLLFLSDIPPKPSSSFPSDKFALVDHNKLGARYTSPSAVVTAIIDHHADEGQHQSADPRKIQSAGSCSSLVTHVLLSSTAVQESKFDIPTELATLLTCAMLIDTNALKPKGKAESVDFTAALDLLPRSSLASVVEGLLPPSVAGSDPTPEQEQEIHAMPVLQELTNTLSAKKTDLSHLSSYDILRRDFKDYTYEISLLGTEKITINAGLSTVPLPLKAKWAADGELLGPSLDWMTARNLSILGVLTSFKKEKKKSGKTKHRRETAWFVRSTSGSESDLDALAEKLFSGLEASDLKLKKYKVDVGERRDVRVRAYKQKNVDVTRKGIAPLLEKILVGSSVVTGLRSSSL